MADEINRFTFEISPEYLSYDGDPNYEWNAIGSSGLKHTDADAKVSGTAIYTRDVAVPGMLYARVLTSPFAHAEIKSIDSTATEALPGIIKVIKWNGPEAQSLSAAQDAGAGATGTIKVLSNEAIYEGEVVGAIVVAETDAVAEEGVRLLKVEWEVYPFSVDIDTSLKGEVIANPNANPDDNKITFRLEQMGDAEAAFKKSDHVVSFSTYRSVNTWAGVEAGTVYSKQEMSGALGSHTESYLPAKCHERIQHSNECN
jgi:xanthine dehydrogenase molybdenum-binding subunit